jgi:hypothetical protein
MTGLTLAAALLLALWRPARRLAWLAVRATIGGLLALAAMAVEQHRTRRELPPAPHQPAACPDAHTTRQPPPVPQRWRVRLSTRVDGFVVTLADGIVVGPWRNAAEVRAEALARLAEATGAPSERVYAEAWPVATAPGDGWAGAA